MKKSAATSALIVLAVINTVSCAGDIAHFSYDPPEGWEVQDRPDMGMNYRVWMTTPTDGFAPNITIVEADFAGSNEEFVRINTPNMTKALPPLDGISRQEFVSDSELKAIKLTWTTEVFSKFLSQSVFVFEKGNRKFVVTATTLEKDADALGPIIEKSMKTATIN